MHLAALLALFLCAEPTAADSVPSDQQILRTFREEFVAITPGQAQYPAAKELPEQFSVAKYEVTQELWKSILRADPSRWKGKRNSVECSAPVTLKSFVARQRSHCVKPS